MARRWGWLALAAIGSLLFVTTALGGAWVAGLTLTDGPVLDALGGLVSVGVGLLFWKWITLGAWYRANPPVDPETGLPTGRPEPIGPWGVVGRVLMVLLVGSIVVGGIWFATLDRRATAAAEKVRDQAERTVRRKGLTVEQVSTARDEHWAWAWQSDGTADNADPYDALLTVAGADLVDVSVGEGEATILLHPDESPPCVVVTIDGNDLVRSRLTPDCN